MTIYFVDIDASEMEFYGHQFPNEHLVAVGGLAEVDPNAEIVCAFIDEPIDSAFLGEHPQIRFIASRSTSTDHIDLRACAERGVLVSHVPHYGEESVAEHTFALMLALARRLREVMQLPSKESFSYEGTRGFELHGKTLGIIGMGRVGRRVASMAAAFGMQVIATDVDAPPDLAETLHFRWVPLDELFATADVITLHAPVTSSTDHIINATSLARMERGVLIVNTARGALVDTAALRGALESGHVGGVGLDVLQDERVFRQPAEQIITDRILRQLRSHEPVQETRDAAGIAELEELVLGNAILARPNVIFTPHVAFNTVEAVQRLHTATAENIRAFIAGHPQNLIPSPPNANELGSSPLTL